MDLILFLSLFTFIKSTQSDADQAFKKINQNVLNLKITETGENIVVSLSSKDYLPLLGSWLTENKIISSNQFYTQGNGIYDCLNENLIGKPTFKYFLNTLSNRVFEFETEKEIFEKKKDIFEYKLDLVKEKDLQIIASNYFDKISTINPLNKEDLQREFDEVIDAKVNCGITFGVKFTNKDDSMPNFDKYERVVYNSKKNIDLYPDKKTLKKKAVSIGKNAVVGVAFFAPYAMLLGYFVSKRLK